MTVLNNTRNPFMRNLITTLFLSLFITTSAMAGGGHAHGSDGGHSHSQPPVSKDEAISRASKKVNQLATKGVIDETWKDVKAHSATQKRFSKGAEWVITFKNDNVKDSTKQNLYLFFSLDGHYIAANYSGK